MARSKNKSGGSQSTTAPSVPSVDDEPATPGEAAPELDAAPPEVGHDSGPDQVPGAVQPPNGEADPPTEGPAPTAEELPALVGGTGPQAPTGPQHYIVVRGGRYAADGVVHRVRPGAIVTEQSHDLAGLRRQGIVLRECAPPREQEYAYGEPVRRRPRRQLYLEGNVDTVEILAADGSIIDVRPGRT